MKGWWLTLWVVAVPWPAKAQIAPLFLPFPTDPGQAPPVRVPALPRPDSPPAGDRRSPRSHPGGAPSGGSAPCTNFIESNGRRICL